MKLSRILVAVLACILWGGHLTQAAPEKVTIVTSFYPMYVMARNVAGDIPAVTVHNCTSLVSGCPHDYVLTVEDMKTIARADVFVANGAGMESFLLHVIRQYPALKVIEVSRGIPLQKDRTGRVNPHVWVSISHAITQVRNLAQALEEFDPAHGQQYRRNAAAYISRLEELKDRMTRELAPYRGRKIITFHEAFVYFADEFGLEIAAVIEREPGSQPSAQELAATIEVIRAQGIKAIFAEPQYPALSAQLIARETGAKMYLLDPAVTGPDEPDTYLRIMEHNLAVLKEALQ